MTTRLVLVRHGEARAGVERFIAGHDACTGLTDRGRDQAARLRDRLARRREIEPDALYVSILARAIETAEIVQPAFPSLTITRNCDFCEQHAGEAEGLSVAEYIERYGDIDDPDPDKLMSPGGESPRMFDARVRRATAELVERHRGETVVLFTHGGFVMAATRYLLGAPGVFDPGVYRLPPRNTSLNVLVAGPDETSWALERYSDAAHLDDD